MAILRAAAIVCAFSVMMSISLVAQDPGMLTIDRIFNSTEFDSESFGPARWLEDNTGYTTLEQSETVAEGTDIVQYDPETGRRTVLVSASSLVPENESVPLEIEDYSWSPDGTICLIFTNSERVWRQNTRGDYWTLDLNSGELTKLGGDADPSTLMFATFSPDGKRIAYVIKNNIFVQDVDSGGITQLTFDGSVTIINGTFDWVYEEEFGLRNGIRWSPDSKSIAYWQLDAEGVGEFYMINNTDSIYSKIIPVQYPKVGTTNSACRIGVISASGGNTTWIKLPGDPRNNYIARMDWTPTGEDVLFQWLNRHQNNLKLVLGNPQTGEVSPVLIEKDDAWVDVVDDLKWIDGGSSFTWVSEKDGWRHIYAVRPFRNTIRSITKGEYDVISVEKIDSKNGYIYFIASPENNAQRYLYRISVKGYEPQLLTPSDKSGTHSYQISHDAKWAIHRYSAFEKPTVIELVSLPDHTVIRTLAENRLLAEKVAALKKQSVEFHRIMADGTLFDAYMMKPYDFNPAKKYPVLFHVYGEPAGQTVLDRWSGTRYLWHLMLTQKGYIVMSVDNRGTPAPRGRDWRKSVYGQIGILASEDQAAAVKASIGRWNFIDPERIGIWGWSGGGSMSLNMIFRYPEIYSTAMSIAPVANQRYYDTIYQERYMGLPHENEYGYKHGSPITYAHQLQGNLLLIHGTGDDNVHYQNTEALINELIKHNKQFTMMSYPNRTHGIREGYNTTRHLYTLLTNYLFDKMPPNEKN